MYQFNQAQGTAASAVSPAQSGNDMLGSAEYSLDSSSLLHVKVVLIARHEHSNYTEYKHNG